MPVWRMQGDPVVSSMHTCSTSPRAKTRHCDAQSSDPAASSVEAAAEAVAKLSSVDTSQSSSSKRLDAPPDMFRADEGRWGSREVEIVGVELFGSNGRGAHVFQSGDPLEVRMHVKANQPVADVVFGVGIFNADGVCCYGTNTQIDGATKAALSGSGEVRLRSTAWTSSTAPTSSTWLHTVRTVRPTITTASSIRFASHHGRKRQASSDRRIDGFFGRRSRDRPGVRPE